MVSGAMSWGSARCAPPQALFCRPHPRVEIVRINASPQAFYSRLRPRAEIVRINASPQAFYSRLRPRAEVVGINASSQAFYSGPRPRAEVERISSHIAPAARAAIRQPAGDDLGGNTPRRAHLHTHQIPAGHSP